MSGYKNRKRKETINACQSVASEKITIDEHKYALEQINMWINNADSKVSTFCALFTIAYGAIAFMAENVIARRMEKAQVVLTGLKPYIIILSFTGAITFFLSMWLCFRAISPKLTGMASIKELKNGLKPKYSIFYGKIAQIKTLEEYLVLADNATKEDFKNDILNEIYINSGICTKKMKNFRMGIRTSYVAIIIEFVCSVVLYWAYQP